MADAADVTGKSGMEMVFVRVEVEIEGDGFVCQLEAGEVFDLFEGEGFRAFFRSAKLLSLPVPVRVLGCSDPLASFADAAGAGFAVLVYACSKRMRSLSKSWYRMRSMLRSIWLTA